MFEFSKSFFGDRSRNRDPKKLDALAREGDLKKGLRKVAIDLAAERGDVLADRVTGAADELKRAAKEDELDRASRVDHGENVINAADELKRAVQDKRRESPDDQVL